MKKSFNGQIHDHAVEGTVHTNATPIKQSSNPKAFTIFNRTKHLSEYAMMAAATNVMLTPRSSGPRFGIDMSVCLHNRGVWSREKGQDRLIWFSRVAFVFIRQLPVGLSSGSCQLPREVDLGPSCSTSVCRAWFRFRVNTLPLQLVYPQTRTRV
jgi:hypothetical protein